MTQRARRRLLQSALATWLASPGLVAAAVGQSARPAPDGRILRRVVSTEITSMDPQRPTGQVTTDLAAELFVGLTYYDRAGRLAPGCALRWQSSTDGLEWTFQLRDGLRWSDGRPLSAQDFVFTLRRYLDPATAASQAGRLEAIRGAHDYRRGRVLPERLGVDAPDARTVRFRLEYPDLELPAMVSQAYCVPEHVVRRHGGEWLHPSRIVSNGAYSLEGWAAGAKVIRLRRNPHYYDAGRVAIERVHWLTGYDDATRLRLFKLGEAEVCTVEDAGNLRTARSEFPRALRSSQEAAVGWLGLNVSRGRMADPRLRRALSLVIDRNLLVGPVRGLGELSSDAFLPARLPGYPESVLPDYAGWPMSRRAAAAKELLRQAGITPEALPPLVVGYAVSPTLRKVFLAIAAMWKSIGIRTELQPFDGRAYNVALTEGRFDAFSYAAFAQVPSPVVFLDRFLSDSPMNFSAWRSAEYDRVLRGALHATTDARRVANFAAAERILLRELPAVPLWIGGSNHLVSDRVQGWVDHPGHAHPSQYLSWQASPRRSGAPSR